MDRAAGYASHLDRIGAETIGATARLISAERYFKAIPPSKSYRFRLI